MASNDTGEEPIKFGSDSDRQTWRDYATAALREQVASAQRQVETLGTAAMARGVDATTMAAASAAVADAMLLEDRRRRRPRKSRLR